MHLRIDTVYPQLRIDYQWPRLHINQQVGHFEYEYDGPAIYIDQRQPRSELGMGGLHHLLRTKAAEGHQTALQGIARRAYEGDRFAREMTAQNTVAQLAKEQSFAQIPEINVDIAPKTRPEITAVYRVHIRWIDGGADIKVNTGMLRIDLIKGRVDISLAKGNKLDLKG